MTQLLDLPFEILQLILSYSQVRNDTNAVVQTCRYLYHTFNDYLYRYDLDHCNRSALFWAAKNDVPATAAHSLRAGPYAEVRNMSDHTPFTIAASRGCLGIIQQLLVFVDNGLDIEIRGENGRTALAHAACYGQTEAVKLLLDRGAKFAAGNLDQKGPLILASLNGHHETVKLLLDYGAVLEETDQTGLTALGWAATFGKLEVINILLERGAELESRTTRDSTPLMLAVRHGNEAAVKRLLEAGADPNASSVNGWTVLHHSLNYPKAAVVKLLLDAGSDPRAVITGDTLHNGRTPAELVGKVSSYRAENEAVRSLLTAAESRDVTQG
ncbi:ankyrin repeat-containing domain protein [Aspergillus unguis]